MIMAKRGRCGRLVINIHGAGIPESKNITFQI